MKYAIVKNEVVTNLVVWDGVSPFTVDGELILATDDAWIGGGYVNGAFVPQPEPTISQLIFFQIAVQQMNEALELTDKFIVRADEYASIFPPTISGSGQVNAFSFELADVYNRVKGWREDIIQTTRTRVQEIAQGADQAAWQAALDNNVFATPTEDDVAALVDQIANQGDFRNTSDTSDWGEVPVVNSVYQYKKEMQDVVTQQLNKFWMKEQANSTMYREAERIRIGNSNSSYMHEQIIGNAQYENWYKGVVSQYVSKMDAIEAATTYEQADTAYAIVINVPDAPMPITWTTQQTGWARRTAEATDTYNALQSARAKLVALGLTDNEALALCYYEGDDKRMLGEWV